MLCLSDNNQPDVVEAFTSTSRHLDDLFNIDNPNFEQMVGQIYPTELHLNKANKMQKPPFWTLICNGMFHPKFMNITGRLILK